MEVIKLPPLPTDLKYNISELQKIIQRFKDLQISFTKKLPHTPHAEYIKDTLNECVEFKHSFNPSNYEVKDLESYHDALAYRYIEPQKSYLRGCYPETLKEFFVIPRFEIFENVYFDPGDCPERFIMIVNNTYYKMHTHENTLFPSDFYIPMRHITTTNIYIALPPGKEYSCGIIGGYFNHFHSDKLFDKGPIKMHGFTIKDNGTCSYDGKQVKV